MKVSPLTKAIVGLTAAGAAYVWVQKEKEMRCPLKFCIRSKFTGL